MCGWGAWCGSWGIGSGLQIDPQALHADGPLRCLETLITSGIEAQDDLFASEAIAELVSSGALALVGAGRGARYDIQWSAQDSEKQSF